MTTPNETKQIVKMAYTQWAHTEPGPDLATLWHAYLAEHPIEIVSPALRAVLRHANEFPPTIADLMDEIENPTLRKKPTIDHPPECHCSDYLPGALFCSELGGGAMPCPGPLDAAALREYEIEWLRNDAAERAQQPHYKALPKPGEIMRPDFTAALEELGETDEGDAA